MTRATALPSPANLGARSDPAITAWSTLLLNFVDRHRHLFLLATACVLVLGFNGQWQVEPDSALYLTLGRNLAKGRGYTYHGVPHDLVYSGLPFAIAGIYRLFGNHVIAACDMLILLCGLATLGSTYRLFALAVDRPTAVLVTVLTGTSHEFSRYCFEVMPDMPFLAGTMAVLAGYEAITSTKAAPKWWDWAIFAGGTFVVVNTKPAMISLLVCCVIAAPWLSRIPHARRRAAFISAIIILCVLLFVWWDPRHTASASSYEQLARRQLLSVPRRWRAEVLRNLAELASVSTVRAVLGMRGGWSIASGLLGAVILLAGLNLARIRLVWGLWIAVTLLKLTLLLSHDRYLLTILPLPIFGWWHLMSRLSARLPRSFGNLLFALLIATTFISNAGGSFAADFRQHRRPFLAHYRDGHYVRWIRMAGELSNRTRDDALILTTVKTARILSFLSDRVVVERIESRPLLHGQNIFVILPVDQDDHAMDSWLERMHLSRRGQPIVTIDAPPSQGGSLCLYSVQ